MKPTPRRPRSARQAIDTGLETRWGGGPANPTLEELQAALEELNAVDEDARAEYERILKEQN